MKMIKKESWYTESLSNKLIIGGVIVVIIAVIIFIGVHTFWLKNFLDLRNSLAQLGDFVGGVVGGLWALAGVILFYVALNEQRKAFLDQQKATNASVEAMKIQVKALELQTKEFELQTQELIETRKVFIDQSNTQTVQQFESIFFNLLSLRNEQLKEMDVYGASLGASNDIFTGTDYFKVMYKSFKRDFENGNSKQNKVTPYFQIFYKKHKSDLGHYFRTIYVILNIVRSNKLKKKKPYTNIFRSQLSNFELLMIFYYCTIPANK